MNTIKTTIRNRRIEVPAPDTWPDGTEVLLEMIPMPAEKIGMEESEWRDDPAALADWEAWIQTIEPLELTPEEEAAFARFGTEMKRFNIEAVRQQMKEESSS
jgi:hypothetical protein